MRIHQVISDYIKKSILTTQGDFLQRGAANPERLALGAAGEMLISNGTIALWYNIWTGMTEGDLIVYSSGAPVWLNPGASGTFLGGNGALAAPSYKDPFAFLTAQGDIIYRDATGKVRLAAGTAGQVLKTGGAGADPSWGDIFSLLTTQGDIVYRDAAAAARLAAGTAGQVLKTGGAGANPSWGNSDQIIEQGAGSETLKVKVVEIGDWNMDSTETVTVAHGLGSGGVIRAVDVVIRKDGGALLHKLMSSGTDGLINGSITGIDAEYISCSRVEGEYFDDTSFDATSFNRGWVTIWYSD